MCLELVSQIFNENTDSVIFPCLVLHSCIKVNDSAQRFSLN